KTPRLHLCRYEGNVDPETVAGARRIRRDAQTAHTARDPGDRKGSAAFLHDEALTQQLVQERIAELLAANFAEVHKFRARIEVVFHEDVHANLELLAARMVGLDEKRIHIAPGREPARNFDRHLVPLAVSKRP